MKKNKSRELFIFVLTNEQNERNCADR